MTRDRVRRVVVALNTALQGTLGVAAFAAAPQVAFAEIATNPTAQQALRLAAWGNLAQAIVVTWLLARADEATIRVTAAGLATYHVLAGIDGYRAAFGFVDVVLAEPVMGPLVVHGVSAAALLLAAAVPGASAPAR